MLRITADELPRFMACNGSRLMGGTLPPITDTTSRDEGIAAHYMAMQIISKKSTIEELADRKAPNGVYMTSDMAEFVSSFVQAIDRPYINPLMIEHETSFSDNKHWNIAGRVDAAGLTFSSLHIDDLKYGWRIVEPEMNWTLISHAVGILTNNAWMKPDFITFTIHQPRPYHPDGPTRSWAVTYDRLMELSGQLGTTLSNPTDELRTSSHCAKCPALPSCPAARKAEMNAIDASETIYEDTISNELLSFNLDTLNRAEAMLKARKEAFEELASHRIKAGQVVDNYSVNTGLGNTKWNDGVDAGMLTALTGKELSKPKLVTPAEAKRLGVPDVIIKSLTHRPTTPPKLVRGNADKIAQRMFKERSQNAN